MPDISAITYQILQGLSMLAFFVLGDIWLTLRIIDHIRGKG